MMHGGLYIPIRNSGGTTTLVAQRDLPTYFRRQRLKRRVKKAAVALGTLGVIGAGTLAYRHRRLLRGLGKVGKGAVGIARKIG